MGELQSDGHPHIQDLFTWAQGARRLGIGDAGLEIDRPFIPDPETETYFNNIRPIKKLLAVLFPNRDAERYYINEVSGFSHLNYGGRTNANIIGFHGSFIRDGTYNVLLEYADRGTLED